MIMNIYFVNTSVFLQQPDVKVLPNPVSAQHIGMDAFGNMHFTCFQLNTLNLQAEGGIKNLVWFDNEGALYKKIIPKRQMLRNLKFVDYDPEVLDKLVTMYFMDVDLQQGSEVDVPLTANYVKGAVAESKTESDWSGE